MKTADDLARLVSYDELTTQIWQDKRATPGARDLLMAMAWVLLRDPERPLRKEYWEKVRLMLGKDDLGKWRVNTLVREDRPRYEPPSRWAGRSCEAPRIRPRKPKEVPGPLNLLDTGACLLGHHPHLGPCKHTTVTAEPQPATAPSTTCDANAKPEYHLIERDPLTGWYIDHWFCPRHRDHYERVRTQLEAAPEAPAPIPNRGGLIGCYFETGLEELYSRQAPHWKPPIYGMRADDWPSTPEAAQLVPKHRRLRLIIGDLVGA